MRGGLTSIRCSTYTICTVYKLFFLYSFCHVYIEVQIAEWSVVRDIGEAKLHPFHPIQETPNRHKDFFFFFLINIVSCAGIKTGRQSSSGP